MANFIIRVVVVWFSGSFEFMVVGRGGFVVYVWLGWVVVGFVGLC